VNEITEKCNTYGHVHKTENTNRAEILGLWVTLNSALDYQINGLYQTPNPYHSPFVC